MANRFGPNKPDPAIKKGVIRARQGAQGAKRAQGMMVAVSLAATMFSWALFSHQDAQLAASTQAAANPVVAEVQQTPSAVAVAVDAIALTAQVTPGAAGGTP
jgi:hypothetical protein